MSSLILTSKADADGVHGIPVDQVDGSAPAREVHIATPGETWPGET
ncbi:hypothetical protein ACPCHT_21215 [Nucisporomicrobium flavum]